MAGYYSGDHRLGPMCVPGDSTPWGIRWTEADPEPWPGFAASVCGMAGTCEELYIFVHAPATARPTTSGGRGSYNYWPVRDVAGRRCYVEWRREVGCWDEEIITIHIAPVAS